MADNNNFTDCGNTNFIDLSIFPVLEVEQEYELALRASKGDKDARNRLVECNMRLVAMIAHKYKGLGVDFSDLFQAGCEGLIKAVENFDITRDFRLSTYAYFNIRKAILNELRASNCILLPERQITLMNKARRAINVLRQDLGCEPTDVEVLDYLAEQGVESPVYLGSDGRMVVSLDEMIYVSEAYDNLDGAGNSDDLDVRITFGLDKSNDSSSNCNEGDNECMGSDDERMGGDDEMEGDGDDSDLAFDPIFQSDDRELVGLLMKQLTEREHAVIMLSVVDGFKNTEIAKQLGYTSQHIGQIKKGALQKMYQYAERHGLRA